MSVRSIFAIALLCLSGFFTSAFAEGADAKAFAEGLGQKALTIITNSSDSKNTKQAKLESLFENNVDIAWIGRFVLGRFWKEANDDQKKQYLANYKTFLIRHYTSNLSEFTDADFQVTKVAPEERGGNIVTMHIKRPNAEDTIVDYTVRKQDSDGYKVYDIVVEGVSMITTQRSEFSSVASQKGLDYLISQLAERSKQDDAQASK